jgi:hypothetical protein
MNKDQINDRVEEIKSKVQAKVVDISSTEESSVVVKCH